VDKATVVVLELAVAVVAVVELPVLAEMVMLEPAITVVQVVQDYNTASVVQHSFMLLEVMAVMKTLFTHNIVVQVVLVGNHPLLKIKDQQML
jgi:hypothetical protein